MEYKNVAAFINRQAEMEYLKKWIEEEPNQILFFFGPKSSKGALIIVVVQRFQIETGMKDIFGYLQYRPR